MRFSESYFDGSVSLGERLAILCVKDLLSNIDSFDYFNEYGLIVKTVRRSKTCPGILTIKLRFNKEFMLDLKERIFAKKILYKEFGDIEEVELTPDLVFNGVRFCFGNVSKTMVFGGMFECEVMTNDCFSRS